MRLSLFSSIVFMIASAVIVGPATQAQQISNPTDQPAATAPVTPWPQRLDSADGLITIYQPQPSKFEGDSITARAAVSLTPSGASDPEFGAIWWG